MLAMRNSPPETSATAPFFEQSWSIKLETLTVTNVSSLGFSLKNLNILMSDASLTLFQRENIGKIIITRFALSIYPSKCHSSKREVTRTNKSFTTRHCSITTPTYRHKVMDFVVVRISEVHTNSL